jgi:hypothetical protein
VLAHAIVKEGAKAVAAGMNPMDLKRGVDLAVSAIVEDLKKHSKAVTSTYGLPGERRLAWFGLRTRDTERCGFPSPRWDGEIDESNGRCRRSFRSGLVQ